MRVVKVLNLFFIFIVFSIMTSNFASYAQVRELEERAKMNKERKHEREIADYNRDHEKKSQNNYNDEWYFGKECIEGCLEATVEACMDWIFSGLENVQYNVLSKSVDQPELISLETMIHAGYDINRKNLQIMPAIRYNYGLVSTFFRYTYMEDVTGQFQTIDWQILQLNIITTKPFNLRIGSGIYWEPITGMVYNDHMADFGLHFMDRRINAQFEYRYCKDYITLAIPRTEANIKVDYRFLMTNRFDFNVMGGFVYQNYYSGVEFSFFQLGINVILY